MQLFNNSFLLCYRMVVYVRVFIYSNICVSVELMQFLVFGFVKDDLKVYFYFIGCNQFTLLFILLLLFMFLSLRVMYIFLFYNIRLKFVFL